MNFLCDFLVLSFSTLLTCCTFLCHLEKSKIDSPPFGLTLRCGKGGAASFVKVCEHDVTKKAEASHTRWRKRPLVAPLPFFSPLAADRTFNPVLVAFCQE